MMLVLTKSWKHAIKYECSTIRLQRFSSNGTRRSLTNRFPYLLDIMRDLVKRDTEVGHCT